MLGHTTEWASAKIALSGSGEGKLAGGGIYSKEDVDRYRDNGADHFSLGTICFTPWKIKSVT